MYRKWLYAFIVLCTGVRIMAEADFLYTRQLMMGSIAFPPTITDAPSLRIYYAGDIIPTNPSRADAQLAFSLFAPSHQNSFHLLITESCSLSAQMLNDDALASNTIDCLRLRPDAYYILYAISYDTRTTQWSWKQVDLETTQVPLDAIILIFDPHLIAGLSGGSSFQLPTIKIKPDIATLLAARGQTLYNYVNQQLIGCLDCDTIHKTRTKPVTKVCQNNRHILQIPNTA